MTLGLRIKTLRVANGLQQGDLGKLLGVSRVSISKMERGDLAVSEARLSQLAIALNTTKGWLHSGIKSETPEAVSNPEVTSVVPLLGHNQVVPFVMGRLSIEAVLEGKKQGITVYNPGPSFRNPKVFAVKTLLHDGGPELVSAYDGECRAHQNEYGMWCVEGELLHARWARDKGKDYLFFPDRIAQAHEFDITDATFCGFWVFSRPLHMRTA